MLPIPAEGGNTRSTRIFVKPLSRGRGSRIGSISRRASAGRGGDHGDAAEVLEKEGARKFIASFDEMLEVIREKDRELVRRRGNG